LKKIIWLFTVILFLLPFVLVKSQQPGPKKPLTRILFVFDCSQSMSGLWESDKKINIARNFLNKTIDSLEQVDNVEMALRVYGHQSYVPPQDCEDTRLEIPFAPNNGEKIKFKLRNLNPKGTTPIANSLRYSVGDFPPCPTCRNIIILITDGIEACDGDPCAVSREIQKKGIALKPFVIGIGLDPRFTKTFECVGQYYNATDEEKFQNVLEIVVSQVLNATTAQVNLLDEAGNPTETDVNMTFYDRDNDRLKQNIVHTLNHRGNPDTLLLDPLVNYRLVVHTIPPVHLDPVELIQGKHNIIAVDAPQGFLRVETDGGTQYRDLQFFVRRPGTTETLNVQLMNTSEKYLTASYDIEIPTLPRLTFKDIEILQSHTTAIKIPRPGVVTLQIANEGYCGLFLEDENGLTWITNVNTSSRSVPIVLLPGTYRAVYRSASAKRSHFTIESSFTVESGKSTYVKIL
jgi:Ca-activated chloride channel family protein